MHEASGRAADTVGLLAALRRRMMARLLRVSRTNSNMDISVSREAGACDSLSSPPTARMSDQSLQQVA